MTPRQSVSNRSTRWNRRVGLFGVLFVAIAVVAASAVALAAANSTTKRDSHSPRANKADHAQVAHTNGRRRVYSNLDNGQGITVYTLTHKQALGAKHARALDKRDRRSKHPSAQSALGWTQADVLTSLSNFGPAMMVVGDAGQLQQLPATVTPNTVTEANPTDSAVTAGQSFDAWVVVLDGTQPVNTGGGSIVAITAGTSTGTTTSPITGTATAAGTTTNPATNLTNCQLQVIYDINAGAWVNTVQVCH